MPFLLHFGVSPYLKVASAGLLCEKKKQYPVLYDKQIKGYRRKDAVGNGWNAGAKDLEFTENGKSKFILFFMFSLWKRIIWAQRRIGRFVLFSRKNNQEGWGESEAYLEPIRFEKNKKQKKVLKPLTIFEKKAKCRRSAGV